MGKYIDIIGQKFGRLLVLKRINNKGTSAQFLCQCDCGNFIDVIGVQLRNGDSTSCGCKRRETCGNTFRKHGKSATREYKILKDAHKRAKRDGRDFNIELSDIIIPKICPVLGIALTENKKWNDNSPSLDRIDNSKGYVKGNIQIISMKANRIKSNSSIDEIEKILEYMKKHKNNDLFYI